MEQKKCKCGCGKYTKPNARSNKRLGRKVGVTCQDYIWGHQNRKRKRPDMKGSGNHFWKRGWFRKKDGYVFVKMPEHPYANTKGYVRQHRILYEAYLNRKRELSDYEKECCVEIEGKRYLKPEAVVHHEDGERGNNRLSNFRLFRDEDEHREYEMKRGGRYWRTE